MEKTHEQGQPELQSEQQKKNPFENLNKDDLVVKCNKLLSLAQKAKHAKDAAVVENQALLEKLSQYESQNEIDQKSIMTMKEMIDALTENKLSLTSQITDYQNNNDKLQKTINSLENQKALIDSEINIENVSLKRQVKRLTDENEDLINDLDRMETKLKEVTEKINLELDEQQTIKWKNLEIQIQNLTEENLKLINKLSEPTLEPPNLNEHELEMKMKEQIERYDLQCLEMQNMRIVEEKHLQKIYYLKTKLLEVLGKLKKLKNCKSVLLQTQAEYAEAVGKWQTDITNASIQLMSYIKILENKLKSHEETTEKTLECQRCKQTAVFDVSFEKKLFDVLECCDNAVQEFNDKSAEIEALLIKFEKIKCLNENLITENNSLKQQLYQDDDDQVQNQETEFKNLFDSYIDAKQCLDIMTKDFNNKSEEFNILQAEFDKISNQNKVVQKSLEDSLDENQKLKQNCEKISNDFQSLSKNIETLSEKSNIQGENLKKSDLTEKALKQELNVLNEKIQEIDFVKLQMKSIIDENNQRIEQMKSENSDLLSEMRELNEALKARGDVISRQQDKITDLEVELKRSTKIPTEIDDGMQNNHQKQSALIDSAETTENVVVTDGGHILNQSSQKIQDTQSEILSISSISRLDNSARLRELDESFEEKYLKVRSIALKLKKKVQEQAAFISNLENSNNLKNVDGSQGGANQMKNIQALHVENDRFLDEIDELKKTVKIKEKECKESKDMINSLNQNLTKSNEELLQAEKSKQAKDNVISEFQSQIKAFKQEKDTFNLIRKELEKERDIERKTAEERLCEKTKIHEQLQETQKELDKLKVVGKQSNVLNLEIQAYEKSLNEASNKLDIFKVQLKELTENVQSKDDTISSLKKEIYLLENQLESEKSHSQELKLQIDLQQQKLKQIEHDKLEMQSKIQDCTGQIQEKLTELEQLRLHFDESLVEKDKLCSELQNDKENLYRQLSQAQEQLETISLKLKTTANELDKTRTEYTSYKVRAQSILRQNQSKESSHERELEEELCTIQANHDALNMKLKKSLEIKEILEKKVEELQQENVIVQKRCNELIDLLEELRLQNDTTVDEHRKQIIQYQETIKTSRLQIDTLNKCYKQQLDDLEIKHLKELNDLKKYQRKNSESGGSGGFIQSDTTSKIITRISPFGGASTSTNVGFKSNDEHKIDLILMEREDGEGSEAASYTMSKRKISSASRSKHDLIPLDELLNSSMDENPREYIEERSLSPNQELQMIKEKLHVQESQIRHLTSLLSESEQDLVKFTQLNDVLKEELRRHERTLEREKHMHNSEYLKNVVLKFLTLNNNDERIRLVPVLNTILKLSPDETNTLQNVAKGLDVSGRSWGSYLPSNWTNHHS